jgi:hypothetical protein
MEQNGCRRNRVSEKNLNFFSRFISPSAPATISVDAVTSREIRIVSSSARGTYDWNCPGFLDRHENRCKSIEMKTINAPICATRRGGQAA